MEPLRIARGTSHHANLTDLALDLAMRSAGFRRSLPEGMLPVLSTLARSVNCYYSNLIEGHHTHPVEIERALKNDYSDEPEERNLQLEARTHIEVQKWIDDGGLQDRIVATDGLMEIHNRFYKMLPDTFRWIGEATTGSRLPVVPGALRERDVRVGSHVPISPGAVPRFLEHFQATYANLGTAETILVSAAAHHRLLWIHPFLDGNGRVARLMSHALLQTALDSGDVWSIARGLARKVTKYNEQLAACDLPRRNGLDGRGALSEEALVDFTRFFLFACIDQVKFMEKLVAPDRLSTRIRLWTEEEVQAGILPPNSGAVLEAVLYKGLLPRSDVTALLGVKDRQARRVTSALLKQEVLSSDSSRAPLRLAFPAKVISRWMPGLFPEAVD